MTEISSTTSLGPEIDKFPDNAAYVLITIRAPGSTGPQTIRIPILSAAIKAKFKDAAQFLVADSVRKFKVPLVLSPTLTIAANSVFLSISNGSKGAADPEVPRDRISFLTSPPVSSFFAPFESQ